MGTAADRERTQREAGVEFFGDALSETERLLLEDAYDLEGLQHATALLWVKLRSAVAAEPRNLRLMLAGMNTLVRLAAAEYRISPKARRDLSDNLAAVLNSLGDLMLPPDG
jgi:hypothetical protein